MDYFRRNLELEIQIKWKKNESLLLLLEKYNVDKVTKSADVFFVLFCILCS